jgi:5'-nucleotidase
VGTDLEVLARKCVSVTPLRLDLTDQAFSEKLAGVLKDRAPA